jgi:hypothetical protein
MEIAELTDMNKNGNHPGSHRPGSSLNRIQRQSFRIRKNRRDEKWILRLGKILDYGTKYVFIPHHRNMLHAIWLNGFSGRYNQLN